MEDGKVMSKLNVLYEDNHIIVVEKPINVLSQGDNTGDVSLLDMVKEYVKEKYNKPGNVYIGLVHRLDRPVGGIMVFAKTQVALKELNKQLTLGKICKTYLALTKAENVSDTDIIKDDNTDNWICLEDYLLKDGRANVSKVVKEGTKDSKKAILYYRCMGKVNDVAVLEVNLITGRHHQIRVQMSHHGMPLIGDTKYNEECSKGQVMLFSYKLGFRHPVTKKDMFFEYKPTYGEFGDVTE
jgi:23S rRNA pseudouridine1911/1915/1917 synthase